MIFLVEAVEIDIMQWKPATYIAFFYPRDPR